LPGWAAGDRFSGHRKRDPRKLELAVRLRQQTTLSVKRIAARLHRGTPVSASVCLPAVMRKNNRRAPEQIPLGI